MCCIIVLVNLIEFSKCICYIVDHTTLPQSPCKDLTPDCQVLDQKDKICQQMSNATKLFCPKYCGLCGKLTLPGQNIPTQNSSGQNNVAMW